MIHDLRELFGSDADVGQMIEFVAAQSRASLGVTLLEYGLADWACSREEGAGKAAHALSYILASRDEYSPRDAALLTVLLRDPRVAEVPEVVINVCESLREVAASPDGVAATVVASWVPRFLVSALRAGDFRAIEAARLLGELAAAQLVSLGIVGDVATDLRRYVSALGFEPDDGDARSIQQAAVEALGSAGPDAGFGMGDRYAVRALEDLDDAMRDRSELAGRVDALRECARRAARELRVREAARVNGGPFIELVVGLGRAVVRVPEQVAEHLGRYFRGLLLENGEESLEIAATVPGSVATGYRARTPEGTRAIWADVCAELDSQVVSAPLFDLIDSLGESTEGAVLQLVDPLAADWMLVRGLPTIHAPDNCSATERGLVQRLSSADVPQADRLERVLLCLQAVANRGAQGVMPKDIGLSTPRQVAYYKQAARLLFLLDSTNRLTPRGRLILTLEATDQMRYLAANFEESVVGTAWLRWCGAETLNDVDPASGEAFLLAAGQGWSVDTRRRRAKTLQAWVLTIRNGA